MRWLLYRVTTIQRFHYSYLAMWGFLRQPQQTQYHQPLSDQWYKYCTNKWQYPQPWPLTQTEFVPAWLVNPLPWTITLYSTLDKKEKRLKRIEKKEQTFATYNNLKGLIKIFTMNTYSNVLRKHRKKERNEEKSNFHSLRSPQRLRKMLNSLDVHVVTLPCLNNWLFVYHDRAPWRD